MKLPPMVVNMVLTQLEEGYDAAQVKAGVADLVKEYPQRIPTIRALLKDVLAELDASAPESEPAAETAKPAEPVGQ